MCPILIMINQERRKWSQGSSIKPTKVLTERSQFKIHSTVNKDWRSKMIENLTDKFVSWRSKVLKLVIKSFYIFS